MGAESLWIVRGEIGQSGKANAEIIARDKSSCQRRTIAEVRKQIFRRRQAQKDLGAGAGERERRQRAEGKTHANEGALTKHVRRQTAFTSWSTCRSLLRERSFALCC